MDSLHQAYSLTGLTLHDFELMKVSIFTLEAIAKVSKCKASMAS